MIENKPIRVIIADDHPIIRHGLARLIGLETDMEVVAEAADGAMVVGLLDTTPCDVLVLDLSLPHIRGLELLTLVKERFPDLAVLIFSVQPEDTFSLHLMDAGASGYLSKDRDIGEVIVAIRTVARGRRFITDRLASLASTPRKIDRPPHSTLSAREYQVFVRVIQGMTVSAIADELEISASTTSSHLARIREKLGVEHTAELLIYAMRAGLI